MASEIHPDVSGASAESDLADLAALSEIVANIWWKNMENSYMIIHDILKKAPNQKAQFPDLLKQMVSLTCAAA